LVGHVLGERCPECGTPVVQFPVSTQTSGKAVASMVLGIVGLVTCFSYGVIGMPCSILAVVFARKAELAVQAGHAPVTSLGMAKAGRVCGWIGIAVNAIALLVVVGYFIMLAVAVF
jgi:hypothetical protein